MKSIPIQNELLTSQVRGYLENFYSRLGSKGRGQINQVSKQVTDIINRNNHISALMHGSSYEYVAVMKKGLTGAVTFGLGFCVDGRIARIYFGPAVSTWEVPAGEIAVEPRLSDGKLIPKSHDLCEGIKRSVTPSKDLFEIFFAHYDSTDPGHGCAAIAGVLQALKAKDKTAAEMEILDKDDIKFMLKCQNAEDANAYLLEKTSIEAITNFYNTCRQQAGLKPLAQVGIVALFDTATVGVTLKKDGQVLSTTELTNQYRSVIQKIFGTEIGKFGNSGAIFTYPGHFLDFSERVLKLIESLLNPHVHINLEDEHDHARPNQFYNHIDDQINQFYPLLTPRQKQALRFFLARTVAFQYMTGLSEVSSHPHHPFATHKETYMAVSERGEFVGKFDTEQAFGSSAADIQVGIKQIKIEISVMTKTNSHNGKPFVLFVCNPISSGDFRRNSKGMQRARANNASFVRSILADKQLRELIREQRLIIIPTLIDDESREVLEIVDHSAYI